MWYSATRIWVFKGLAKSDISSDECIFDVDGSHCEKCTMADPAAKKLGWDNNASPFRDALKYQDDKKVKVKTKQVKIKKWKCKIN